MNVARTAMVMAMVIMPGMVMALGTVAMPGMIVVVLVIHAGYRTAALISSSRRFCFPSASKLAGSSHS